VQDAIVLSSQWDERVRAGLPGADVLIYNSRKVQVNVQIRYKYMYYRGNGRFEPKSHRDAHLLYLREMA
jgi:hypothetical protein